MSKKLFFRFLVVTSTLLALFFPVWYGVVVPSLEKMPADFRYDADIVSSDNFYDADLGHYLGEIRSDVNFYYEFASEEDGVYILRNVFDVKAPDGAPIFAVERLYGIDPNTEAHVPGHGDRDREGYLFAPKHLSKEPYLYWHVNYNAPAVMNFVREEKVLGLNTYLFKTSFTVDQTENLDHLPGVPEERGISVDVKLSLWVEPVTGHLVQYSDDAIAYYYDIDSGERLHPWNHFQNRYALSSVSEHVGLAELEKIRSSVLEGFIPLFVVALLGLSLGLLALTKKRFTLVSSSWFLPVLVLLLGFTSTVLLWFFVNQRINRQDEVQFETEAGIVLNDLEHQMDRYSSVFNGLQGFFTASQVIDRDEWAGYLNDLNLQNDYPGISAVGYLPIVSREELPALIAQARAEGVDYHIYPEGERDLYAPVFYVSPLNDSSAKILGYDMATDPTRLAAMETARDTGTVAVSKRVKLITFSGEESYGFLMYSPIYKKNAPLSSLDQRRSGLQGYVYGVLQLTPLVQEVSSAGDYHIVYDIFDGPQEEALTEDTLIYRGSLSEEERASYVPRFTLTKTLRIYNNDWTFKFFSHYEDLEGDGLDTLVVIGFPALGAILSVLFFILVYALINLRTADLASAQIITRQLSAERAGLAEATAKVEAILRSIGDGVVATDRFGKILFVNRAALELLRVKPDALLGKSLLKVIKSCNADGKAVPERQRPLWQVLKKNAGLSYHSDFYYTRPDGSSLPIALTVAPVLLGGKLIGAIETFRDITKEKDVDRVKTEFVSLASHQLRTPLTAIKWYSEMLLGGDAGALSKEQKEYLTEIAGSNDRMVDLVNDLLNVSRLEMGTFVVEPQSVDLVKLAGEVVQELTPTAHAKKIVLKVSLEKNLPTVTSDPKLFRMIFQNLLSNAIKYTPEKGQVTFNLAQSKDHHKLSFEVIDTGYGIPKSQQGKIFSKLFRASNVQKLSTEGTGLGLYIVKGVVEKLGGEIHFESTEGKGSRFLVSLPLNKTTATPAAASAPSPELPSPGRRTRKKKGQK